MSLQNGIPLLKTFRSCLTNMYSIFLTPQDPCLEEVSNIKKPLKPHQRTALYKCIQMETQPYICYKVEDPEKDIPFGQYSKVTFKNEFKTYTNVGIIGDIVGYGKTLIALGIIGNVPLNSIYVHRTEEYNYSSGQCSGMMSFKQDRNFPCSFNDLIRSTLVVVPKGPVYVQWKKMIEKDTSLKCLYIDSLLTIKKQLPITYSELKTFLESYSLILIKQTTLKVWVQYLKQLETPIELKGFDRVMVDEAHDIIFTVPRFHFKYLWLITSSYLDLVNFTRTRGMCISIYKEIMMMMNRERVHYMLVKNEIPYVLESFEIPPPKEIYYLCKMDKSISALTGFVSASVMDKINVNDIAGAIHELGGVQETETSLMDSVKKDFLKNIQNKEKEIAFVESLELEEEVKEQRLKSIRTELTRLQNRYQSLENRLNNLMTETCPICLNVYENPLYLNCTHTICGKCLFDWVNSSLHTRHSVVKCPECRTPIDSTQIVAIVKQEKMPTLMSKEDQFISILLKKPEGKFLVFSRLDSQYYRLYDRLKEHGISYGEMKGSTSQMMNTLTDFNEGKIRLILLNTHYAGYGIDMSQATDVVIYHSMPQDKIQAVGRAQRVGRKDVLTIHHLCYSHEV